MTAVGTNRRDVITYPTNRVVGTVGTADKAQGAIDALLRAGFDREDIDLLHGEEDLARLDPSGAAHGFLAQFQRRLIRTFDFEEFKHVTHHIEDIRAGRFVVMVLAKRRVQRILASDILHQHGAEFVGFYGRWVWEELPASGRTSPEDIPALFVRAWNDRDARALAALFDEDAEFVTGTGVCWHDRESIRKAHADGLEGIFNTSTLAIGETKVKRLSPEVAVVHARMTCSVEQAPGNAAAPLTRALIVSFVVHRAGERWLCASAHATDVHPNAETNVLEDAGAIGVAPYPNNQVS